jgi:hypothetical protein
MVRVPNSINSKNGKLVKVVQWWNGTRPPANGMLFWFQVHLTDEKLKYDYKHGRGLYRAIESGKEIVISLRESYYKNAPREIHWIEKAILDGNGIADWRKATIHLILVPYLINVKKQVSDIAYRIIMDWLAKCNAIRKLDFNATNKVDDAIIRAFEGRTMYPMRQDTMQSKYPEMYAEIFGRD